MLHVQEATLPYGDWSPDERDVLSRALGVLCKRIRGDVLANPHALKQYLRLRIGGLGYEMFGIILLNSQNAVIAIEEIFRGTLTQTAVYPREIVRRALHWNAAGLIAFHNHPSGRPDPSDADVFLTRTMKKTLSLVDVQLLDHVVVAAESAMSMAELGQI